METLGNRLRRAREIADVSARELDRLAGHREGHVTMIERRDDRPIETTTAAAYAGVLGVTTDWLILGTGPEPTAEQVQAAVAAARARLEAEPKVTGTEG